MPRKLRPDQGTPRFHITLSESHQAWMLELGVLSPHVTRSKLVQLALDRGFPALVEEMRAVQVDSADEFRAQFEPPSEEPEVRTTPWTSGTSTVLNDALSEIASLPEDPQEEARYYAAVRQGLLADDGDFPEDPPGAAEGALEGNDEAASACAVSSPSAAADPRVLEDITSKGDTEPAPPPVFEDWMVALFDQV